VAFSVVLITISFFFIGITSCNHDLVISYRNCPLFIFQGSAQE